MRSIITILAIICTFNLNAQTLPDITVTDTKGVEHNLYKTLESGKVVLLDFFFVDCHACNQLDPELDKLIENYKDTNLEIWSISSYDSDTRLNNSVFKSSHDNHIVVGYQGKGKAATDIFANKYELVGYPSLSVICADKSIAWDIYPLSVRLPEITSKLDNTCGVSSVTAVHDDAIEHDLRVFPNPSSGSVTVDLSDIRDDAEVTLLNTQGQALSRKSIHPHQTSTSFTLQTSGLYLVKIETENSVSTKKVVRL